MAEFILYSIAVFLVTILLLVVVLLVAKNKEIPIKNSTAEVSQSKRKGYDNYQWR